MIDGLIAATALQYGLHLTTRNVVNFETAEVLLVNPSESFRPLFLDCLVVDAARDLIRISAIFCDDDNAKTVAAKHDLCSIWMLESR